MSTRLKSLLLFSTAIMMAPTAFAGPIIVNSDFGAVPIVCSIGYAYQAFGGDCSYPQQDFNSTPGFGWTFLVHGGNGLTGPSTPFNPPSFSGLPFTQAAFLQNSNSSVSQAVGGFVAGSYTLSFYLGSRYDSGGGDDGDQTVAALIDGGVIGTWALTSFTPFTLETASFTVSADGIHTLEFMGLNPGDHTAFLSDVSIAPTATPEPFSLTLMATGLLGCLAKLYRR
jgi:hypothetical protein